MLCKVHKGKYIFQIKSITIFLIKNYLLVLSYYLTNVVMVKGKEKIRWG